MPDPTPGREGGGWIADQFKALWDAIRDIRAASGTQRFNAVEKLQEQIDAQAEIVASIPITEIAETTAGFSPAGSWTTVASVTLPRPAGKNNVSVFASTSVDIAFTGMSGLPDGQVRVVVDGAVGMDVRTSLRATGSGTVDGRMSGSAQHALSRTGGGDVVAEVQVQMGWISGSAGSGTWSARAQIAATATFER